MSETSSGSAKGRHGKRKSPVPMLISAVIVIAVIMGGSYFFQKYTSTGKHMNASAYFDLASEDEIALVVDDEILEQKGSVIDGGAYIDYKTVFSYLNSGFYYEESEGILYLTLPSGTQTWQADASEGAVVTRDGSCYLSFDLIAENSDIEIQYLTEPSRIVARTRFDEVQTGSVTADTEIRYRGGPKSEIIAEVKAGDTLAVKEQMDSWSEVATSDGFVGYIRNKHLSVNETVGIEHSTDERFVFPKQLMRDRVVMAWQYAGGILDVQELQGILQRAVGLNVISPTWFRPKTADGELTSFADKAYVDAVHAAGVDVWAMFGDGDSQDVNSGEIFLTEAQRSHIITQLLDAAAATGFDGINLDFETIREDSAPQYLQFIRELSIAAHDAGLVISVDNFVPIYTPYYQRAEQARVADYVVIMGYDEHTGRSDEAGPVASLPFVKQGIEDTLKEVPKEQIINAVPFYTRGWTEDFGDTVPKAEVLGMDNADAFAAAHGIETAFDESLGLAWGTADTEDARYTIWLENEQSLSEKIKLIDEYELAGVACWRLGYERDTVWSTIQEHF